MTAEVLTKFDPYAMVKPKTEEDLLVLLQEASRELDALNEHLRRVTYNCEIARLRKKK